MIQFMQLQRRGEGQRGGAIAPALRVREGDDDERLLLCARCGRPVTKPALAVEHAGRHRHTCVNPAGVVYRIALYRDAPGCRGHGGWSEVYSWFAGRQWQIVCCAGCGEHLGWRFRPAPGQPEGEAQNGEAQNGEVQGRRAGFYGLIAARLIERGQGRGA